RVCLEGGLGWPGRPGGGRMPRLWPSPVVLAASCVTACLGAGAAAAQDAVEAFYRGKTVTITVGSAVGGGYDTYARLVARHLGRHISRNPTVAGPNTPRAGRDTAGSHAALPA